jgi:hypothetical protein
MNHRKHSPKDRRRRIMIGPDVDRRILRLRRLTGAASHREIIDTALRLYEAELARSERVLELARMATSGEC